MKKKFKSFCFIIKNLAAYMFLILPTSAFLEKNCTIQTHKETHWIYYMQTHASYKMTITILKFNDISS